MALKIDAHHHFWHYQPEEYGWINDSMQSLKRDFLPEDFQILLAQHDFDGSVVVQSGLLRIGKRAYSGHQ